METKKYKVDEPTNIGVVESFLKYTTLTIVTALLSYFAAFILPLTRQSTRHNDEFQSEYYGLIFGNLEMFNVLISLIAVGVMAYYIYSKNRYGRIFEIQVTSDFVQLTIKNTFNNKIRKVDLARNTLVIQKEPKSNDVFGEFEIVTFYSAGKKVNYFNTALSQWGNDEESYKEMMNELENRQKTGL